MSTQFIALATTAQRWSWRPSDRYGGGQFGFHILLPNETINFGGQLTVLERQDFWMNVSVSQAQMNRPSFQDKLQKLQGVVQGGVPLVATSGRLVTSKAGKQSLKFQLSGLRLPDTLPVAINRAVLDVEVEEVNDRWLLASESYRVPHPKDGENPFRKRKAWVCLPYQMQLTRGQQVYVEGHLAARSPNGEKNLYVIADLVT